MNLNNFNQVFLDVVDIKLNRGGKRFLTRFAHGECMMYAYVLKSILGGVAYSYRYDPYSGHCFVKFNNRYYDAENPEGVTNWKRLQSFMKNSKKKKPDARHLKPHKILDFWGTTDEKSLWDEIIFDINAKLNLKKAS